MNKHIKKKFDDAAFELATKIKKDNTPNIYSYMVISSSTVIEIFFTAVSSVKKEDFAFSTKEQYIKNLSRLKKDKIQALYVFFLLDYFAFLKLEMDPRFFDVFPISYEELLDGFNTHFKNYKSELALLDKVIVDYEKPYHPRTFLQRTGLPKEQEDLFLLHSLNELKFELFHQFNKNITRLINAANRTGGSRNE